MDFITEFLKFGQLKSFSEINFLAQDLFLIDK